MAKSKINEITRADAEKEIEYFFGEDDVGRKFLIKAVAKIYKNTFSEGGLERKGLSSAVSIGLLKLLASNIQTMTHISKLVKALQTHNDLAIELIKKPGFIDFLKILSEHTITLKGQGSVGFLQHAISNTKFFTDLFTIFNHPDVIEAISLLKKDPEKLKKSSPSKQVLEYINIFSNEKSADLVIKLLSDTKLLRQLASNPTYTAYFNKINDVLTDTLELTKLKKELAELEKSVEALKAPRPSAYMEIDLMEIKITKLKNKILGTKKDIKRLLLSNPKQLHEISAIFSGYSDHITDSVASSKKYSSHSKVAFKILNNAVDEVERNGGDIIAVFIAEMLKTVDQGSQYSATPDQKADKNAVIELLSDVKFLKKLLYRELISDPTMLKNRRKFALSGVTIDTLVDALKSVISDKSGTLHNLIENQELAAAISLATLDKQDVTAAMSLLNKAGYLKVASSGMSLGTNKNVRALIGVTLQLQRVDSVESKTKTEFLHTALELPFAELYDSEVEPDLYKYLNFLSEKMTEATAEDDILPQFSPEDSNLLFELTALRSLERCNLTNLSFAGLVIDNFTIMHSKVNCNFTGAKIVRTAFDNSAISANFTGATITKCSFDGAKITPESLASLSGAIVDVESFKGIIAAAKNSGISPIIIPNLKITGNLSGVDLTHIHFLGTDFRNVYSMEKAKIYDCIFSSDCTFDESIFNKAYGINGAILPNHPFAALLNADLRGLGEQAAKAVKQVLLSIDYQEHELRTVRGSGAVNIINLENNKNVILDDYFESIHGKTLNVQEFVQRTLCTRVASKIAKNLFGTGSGRQNEVLEFQKILYKVQKDSDVDLGKLLDDSPESKMILKQISDEIKNAKYTESTPAAKFLFSGGIKFKDDAFDTLKDRENLALIIKTVVRDAHRVTQAAAQASAQDAVNELLTSTKAGVSEKAIVLLTQQIADIIRTTPDMRALNQELLTSSLSSFMLPTGIKIEPEALKNLIDKHSTSFIAKIQAQPSAEAKRQ